ncbi:phospholipase [Legionella pneumophila serogroup 1]
MLKNITRALSLSLLISHNICANEASSIETISQPTTIQFLEKFGAGFANLEHKNLGDRVQLYLPDHNSKAGIVKLRLPNGSKLSYGEIVMYGGDMFGNPAKPISNCSEKNRLACFQAQFDALGTLGNKQDKRCSNPLNQITRLDRFFTDLAEEIEKSKQNGTNDWDYYKQHDSAISKELNKLTCGGSLISGFIPFGNYIKLAEVNYDHFVPDSLIAYKTGHRFALETALKAYEKKQQGLIDEAQKLLELAYAQNAFANHYLTDSFSAGHMRTPRRAIGHDILLPSVLNLLIANLMHNEDNQHGLNVVNHEGISWLAYGDGYLYKPEAELQRVVILDAMQRSADSIHSTFMNGVIPEHYPEMDVFPDYSKIEQTNDTAPLFKVENGVLLKRVNNKDHYDHHWTKHWSGLVTLIEFQVNKI